MKRLLALTVVALALGGCNQSASSEARYDMAEFTISGPGQLSPVGQIEVTNNGEYPHTVVVSDLEGAVIAATGLVAPGGSTVLDVDLTAGTYQFTCRIVAETADGTIVDHFERGMSQTVEVSG
jgi:plastocyanin